MSENLVFIFCIMFGEFLLGWVLRGVLESRKRKIQQIVHWPENPDERTRVGHTPACYSNMVAQYHEGNTLQNTRCICGLDNILFLKTMQTVLPTDKIRQIEAGVQLALYEARNTDAAVSKVMDVLREAWVIE